MAGGRVPLPSPQHLTSSKVLSLKAVLSLGSQYHTKLLPFSPLCLLLLSFLCVLQATALAVSLMLFSGCAPPPPCSPSQDKAVSCGAPGSVWTRGGVQTCSFHPRSLWPGGPDRCVSTEAIPS